MIQDITLEERWSETRDFPNYLVSTEGRVLNRKTGKLVKPTVNSTGVVIIGLMYDGRQHKRSLGLLVADAFVPRPQHHHYFDTPIHLNGDRQDNHYTNLVWRPLWFARKYMRQFIDGHTTYRKPIEDVETGEMYENSMDAAVKHGLLDNELCLSMLNNGYAWPTGQVFRKVA